MKSTSNAFYIAGNALKRWFLKPPKSWSAGVGKYSVRGMVAVLENIDRQFVSMEKMQGKGFILTTAYVSWISRVGIRKL